MNNEELEYNHFLKNLFSSQPSVARHIFFNTHIGHLEQVIQKHFTQVDIKIEELLIRVLIRIGDEINDFNPYGKLKFWLISKIIQEALRTGYELPMDLLMENLNCQTSGFGMRMQLTIDRIFEGNRIYEERLKNTCWPFDVCG